MLKSIWSSVSEILENQNWIIRMTVHDKEIIPDKELKYFEKEHICISENKFIGIVIRFIDKRNKSYISDIYNRVKNSLFVYRLKDEYSPNVLSLEFISFICKEYEKWFPDSGFLYIDSDSIEIIYESEQKIKALENIVLNLILVNIEYKRQIEGL